jgi:hypothetical protein
MRGVEWAAASARRLPAQNRMARLAPAYALWLPPAVLAAVLDLSPWFTLALLVPGIIWYGFGEGVRSYTELRRAKPEAPVGNCVPALYALPLFIVAIAFAARFAGVLIVAGFAYVDLILLWKRTRQARSPANHIVNHARDEKT